MDECYYCGGVSFIESSECITCLSCSRTRNEIITSYNVQAYTSDRSEYMSMFSTSEIIDEIASRYGIYTNDSDIMKNRLYTLKYCKCTFSKRTIILTLYYISLLESENRISPVAFVQLTGGNLSVRELNMCTYYISNKLKIDIFTRPATWDSILSHSLASLHIVKHDAKCRIIRMCDYIHSHSSLSVYTVGAVSIVLYLYKYDNRYSDINFAVKSVCDVTCVTLSQLKRRSLEFKNVY